MKTILVATDYSKAANNALTYAAALAKELKARLQLFNALQLPPPIAVAVLPKESKHRYLNENNARLEQTAKQLSRLYGIDVGWGSSFSELPEVLNKQVALHKADLVVVGMRSNSEASTLVGNGATSVLRHAHYPVLVVPEEAYFSGINKILFACEYHFLKKDSTLDLLQELAQVFKAKVQVLHVEKEAGVAVGLQSEATAQKAIRLEERLHQLKHEYKYLEASNVLKGIDQGLEEFDADLLVMVPHKTSFWDAVLHEGNTCKMAYHTHVPLLALPNS